MNEKTDNENIIKALKLIYQKKNIFITGHAGTGKSYILTKLKEHIPDLVITSTTGIAAVNVKGQTLHSWAGMGICNKPISNTVGKILKNKTLNTQIQNCNIIAVDEISMLDRRTFEYVNEVLKQVKDSDKPFGGIQVVFIGDFFQLPPVKENDSFSESNYCFESDVWNELDLQTVLLTKTYRQNEENLITALSHLRLNSLNNEDLKLLESRFYNDDDNLSDILHIFATNNEADRYNQFRFNSINSKQYDFEATDYTYFDTNILNYCKADKKISLKVGARVILLINLSFEKGLINGACGEVLEINDNSVLVRFDNGFTSEIKKHEFEFYKNDKLIATRKQFPLRLAYGITIHKSQGMTLDKLVVDCSRIFEKGQTYVALSRIKTLNGLYLKNFNPNKIKTDKKIIEFYENLLKK